MTSPVSLARAQQRAWAQSAHIEVDQAGYTHSLNENLFVPLSADALSEIRGGDGDELGSAEKKGKIQALHSSSALACNVFEYWRPRDRTPLASALGLRSPISKMEFERKFPTGLPGNPPNLDVTLTATDGCITAIESKFLEPYSPHALTTTFKPSYFASDVGLWRAVGFTSCQLLAEDLYAGRASFAWLNAEQLLKHILGLVNSTLSWQLIYLWFNVPGEAGVSHASEVLEFSKRMSCDGVPFRAMTYQTLFAQMQTFASDSDSSYLQYLGARFFS